MKQSLAKTPVRIIFSKRSADTPPLEEAAKALFQISKMPLKSEPDAEKHRDKSSRPK
jgi:hypothetical protein